MDRVFVNKYEGNLAHQAEAVDTMSSLPWLRFEVACSASIRKLEFMSRLIYAMSIRMQTYLQAIAIRLKLELALYDAEVTAKKAAPGR